MHNLIFAVAIAAAALVAVPAANADIAATDFGTAVVTVAEVSAPPSQEVSETVPPVERAAAGRAPSVHSPARASSPNVAVEVITSRCLQAADGTVESAPSVVSPGGVGGTTSDDLNQFARAFNAIRVANCLPPIALENFRYDSCMEQRLFWMAEDPSEDPLSAWGHMGSQRSDGLPSVGCDGNLAGGSDNTGATVAQKWWDSLPHRAVLYRPDEAIAGVCIEFAMTHGGIPDEPYAFTRAAARWDYCD